MIRWAKIAFVSGLFIATLWCVGLVYFISILPTSVEDNITITGGVVVLTGGKGRINEGISLLLNSKAQKLLITGVDYRIKLEEIKLHYTKEVELFKDKITLGYVANNTKTNVQETVDWMRENNFKTIRLVTSAYHMPRAKLDFQKYIDKNNMVLNPVISDQFQLIYLWQNPSGIKLMIWEYSKFLWSYLGYLIFIR